MRLRPSVVVLLAAALALVGLRVGRDLYRYHAFSEERARIEAMTDSLETVALEVFRTRLGADSLYRAVERMDRDLAAARRAVDAYERHAFEGMLPGHLYDAYQAELAGYNRRVAERNAQYEAWRAVVARNHVAVDRYNALADRIRALAARMGEPYYPLPTPEEVALERGLWKP